MSGTDPIAFTYDADTHCPACTFARFGREAPANPALPCYPWPAEDARDSEGNPIGAIAPWDDWCDGEDGPCTLACGTCLGIIETHGPHDPTRCDVFAPDSLGDDPRVCSGCLAHVDDHTDPFAVGYRQGYIDALRQLED